MDSDIEKPLVSIIMPVYNCQDYVKGAIESILNQTFNNFEFLIIDDCSSDNSLEVIQSFKDSRIKLIRKAKNSGISETLNLGLKQALGKYIVRMDADDVSYPLRIEKQVRFLEANSDYILCGTNYTIIGENNSIILPEKNDDIKLMLLNDCCIAHPTVTLRKSVLDINQIFYSNLMEPAEDYNLWVLLTDKGKFYNIQEDLLVYRVHFEQVSRKNKKEQDRKSLLVKLKYFTKFYEFINSTEEKVLKKILIKNEKVKTDDITVFSNLVSKFKKHNYKTNFFNIKKFNKYILDLENSFLVNYFAKNERYLILDFFKYLRLNRKFGLSLNFKNKSILFLKSIFFYKI